MLLLLNEGRKLRYARHMTAHICRLVGNVQIEGQNRPLVLQCRVIKTSMVPVQKSFGSFAGHFFQVSVEEGFIVHET
jgi:hypothetical protein